MVESRHVLNGLIAGFLAGIALGVYITITTIPSIDRVVDYAVNASHSYGISLSGYRSILYLAIYIAPLITIFFMMLLGAVLGAVLDYLSKRLGLWIALSSTIAVLALILVVPNIITGDMGKVLENLIALLTYSIVLSILTIIGHRRSS